MVRKGFGMGKGLSWEHKPKKAHFSLLLKWLLHPPLYAWAHWVDLLSLVSPGSAITDLNSLAFSFLIRGLILTLLPFFLPLVPAGQAGWTSRLKPYAIDRPMCQGSTALHSFPHVAGCLVLSEPCYLIKFPLLYGSSAYGFLENTTYWNDSKLWLSSALVTLPPKTNEQQTNKQKHLQL